MVKLLAFYLPQYHRIPENDEWWGEGFTEWTNVKKSKPLYRGHYQPREPLNGNYYDLSNDKVMEWQMGLARKYGIGGFCFFHYWFSGKTMLETPTERLLRNTNANLPFCFSWANHDWERTWFGIRDVGDRELLIKQKYGGEEEWKNHFNYLLPFFKDGRYIKEDNKPMFLIYRSGAIRRCKEMLKLWNGLARENGFDGMFFVSMQMSERHTGNNEMFSAKVDFEPGKWQRDHESAKEQHVQMWKDGFLNKYKNINFLNRFFCYSLDYDKMYQDMLNKSHEKNEYRGVFVGYDTTARKGRMATIINGSSPRRFESYLTQNIKKSLEEGNEYLFINAWNEWGEGNYLEPDERYGYAYLNAVRRALAEEKKD